MENPFSPIWNNIAHKARNPFLGTFAFVWFARNWRAVYAVFAFEEGKTIEQKVAYIDGHLRYDSFCQTLGELGLNVAWALGILIVAYTLINVSRYISNIFENRVTPWIYKISSTKDFDLLLKAFSKEEIIDAIDHVLNKRKVLVGSGSDYGKVINYLL